MVNNINVKKNYVQKIITFAILSSTLSGTIVAYSPLITVKADNLQNVISSHQNQIKQTQQQLNLLKFNKSNIDLKISGLSADNARLNEDNYQLNIKKSQLFKQKDNLTNQKDVLQNKLDDNNNEFQQALSLSQKKHIKSTQLIKVHKKIKTLNHQMDLYIKQLKNMQNDITVLQAKINNTNQSIDANNEQIKTIQDELNQLKEQKLKIIQNNQKKLTASTAALNTAKTKQHQLLEQKQADLKAQKNQANQDALAEAQQQNTILEGMSILKKGNYSQTAQQISQNINDTSPERQKVINAALSQIGVDYVWGGDIPGEQLDCSGLTKYAYQQVDIHLPHYTVSQEGYGEYEDITEAQPGDLLFWGVRGGSFHVAIALGNQQYIAAPAPGQQVSIGNYDWFKPDFAVKILK